jgi:hypothetical protein
LSFRGFRSSDSADNLSRRIGVPLSSVTSICHAESIASPLKRSRPRSAQIASAS